MRGATQVTQDPIHQLHMEVSWLMHEHADLLDGVGDVGSSEG